MAVVETDGKILVTLMDLERSRSHLRIEYVSPRVRRCLTGAKEVQLALGHTITIHNVIMRKEVP